MLVITLKTAWINESTEHVPGYEDSIAEKSILVKLICKFNTISIEISIGFGFVQKKCSSLYQSTLSWLLSNRKSKITVNKITVDKSLFLSSKPSLEVSGIGLE